VARGESQSYLADGEAEGRLRRLKGRVYDR
jgi:hypothetical protein